MVSPTVNTVHMLKSMQRPSAVRGKQETWLLIPIVLVAMMAVAASLEWPPSLWRLGAGWYPPHPLGAVHIAPQTHG